MTDFMTQELVNGRNYANIFKRITRYTIKPAGIILDRHAPLPTGEPTIDPEGEWMKCDQLNNIIHAGGLIEYTSDLKERLLDGDAHRGLLRELDNLGYDDFEQVLTILKNNRHQILDKKKYEIWMEGFSATGQEGKAQLVVSNIEAFSFHEACSIHFSKLTKEESEYWSYSKQSNTWAIWGCRLFDNEIDARKNFG